MSLNLYPLKRSFLQSTKFAFFFSTKPCGTKLFSGPLEASRKRPVNGASTDCRLSLRLTRFSCILVIDRKKLWFPWPFSKRKMKCACTLGSRAPATFSESAELSCACPIFRHEKFAEPTRYVFGGRIYLRGGGGGGYDKAGCKILQGRSLFNPVLSVHNTLLCIFQRLCTYFQDTGVLIFGGYVLSRHCTRLQI